MDPNPYESPRGTQQRQPPTGKENLRLTLTGVLAVTVLTPLLFGFCWWVIVLVVGTLGFGPD
jgi:hypothetical protein